MPTKDFLLGIDQGSSGSRALILDSEGAARGYGYRPLARLYPQPNWVEQDPAHIITTVAQAIELALADAHIDATEIAACGIACQRNTEFTWDAQTHQPFVNAITWQDLRTMNLMREFAEWEHAAHARHHLGYAPGPYSTAMHLAWRMRNDTAFQRAARDNTIQVGLSAEWLVTALGKMNAHVMDVSLVQAMGMYDFRARAYWREWLEWLDMPEAPLPRAVSSVYEFGALHWNGAEIPVRAMLGDQQGALFGYDCRAPGNAECTHGTASFVDVFVGNQAPTSDTVNCYFAWMLNDEPAYCLEADTTVTGAAIRWMRETMHLFHDDAELDALAASVPNAGGTVFVPAFTGLNVPYNDSRARASLFGMTLGTTRAHIAHAFFQAIGFQVRGILNTIERESGVRPAQLYVGGGISASDIGCQIQADLIGIPIVRPKFAQTTARAAALLAGLGAGIWRDAAALPRLQTETQIFEPRCSQDERDTAFAHWEQAVRAVRG
jgi:glycerol kinase